MYTFSLVMLTVPSCHIIWKLIDDIMDNIQKILDIDCEIIAYHESLTSIEKNLKQLKKDLTYDDSGFKFIMISHCIKINKQMK